MDDQQESESLEEPSVWDLIVSKLRFWDRDAKFAEPQEEHIVVQKPVAPKQKLDFPWLSLTAMIAALFAQITLEPSVDRSYWLGIIFYIVALGFLIAAILKNEWRLTPLREDAKKPIKYKVKIEFLLVSLILGVLAFLFFGNGEFNFLNTLLWILSLVFTFLAFWKKGKAKWINLAPVTCWQGAKKWKLSLSRWTLIVLATAAVILFFNFHQLETVPPEMLSDQAEKLIDINDVLHGYKPVYFPRNTGREVLHFYLTAAYMAVFNLDVSFLDLKVVAVFANLLTVFFIYLLGKEFGNKRVGLSAALFAGIAYWPLVFTRLALRIPYYPLFVAPVMYFMIRGLRRQTINDVLWAGFFLGLGLHGYTPFRIVPIFVVLGIIIYILHQPGKKRILGSVYVLNLIAFVSLIVFLPLFRYWMDNPSMFGYRAFTRLTQMEVGFQNNPILIFFQNFWKASIMFFWDNGSIWAHSVPGRPALEIVSSALYFLGIVSLLVRYVRNRRWQDLFLLVSIPMMMMPSILSIAFPGENPSLNRTAGAVVPVFVVVGLAFETIIRTVRKKLPGQPGKLIALFVVLLLVVWSGANNYDLVFHQYYETYRVSSWNSSEIGRIAQFFIESVGSPESTYVVGYPHWVDSRLVAINAGYPGMDFAIFADRIPETQEDPQPKMFFLNVNDSEDIALLMDIFPQGVLKQYESQVPSKDFMIYFVPPMQGATP